MSRAHRYREIRQSSFSNLSRHSTYVTTHSPTLPSLYLRHSSFSNSSVASPTSQFILQPFFRFSCLTSSSLNSPGESPRNENELCYDYNYELCTFSNFSVTSPTSQLILQPFRRFTYVTAHSPTLSLLHLRHSSFSNHSFASSTSQALHLRHLASRPCAVLYNYILKLTTSVIIITHVALFTYPISNVRRM